MKTFETTLHDGITGATYKVQIKEVPSGLVIAISGHGDACSRKGAGAPLMLSAYDGKVEVLCWANINQEDPTHIIDLAGALESRRKEAGK